ncbi:MAG TPA: SpoIIE family protein phosphatase [Acetobacteraceae bacterium]|nr:SpoIIE family protein phosphatase [Acetobacteraceae bacterium]
MIEETDSDRTAIFRPQPRKLSPTVHALLLRQDGVPPRRITLGDAPIRIGRGPANELVLASPEVSRQHCWIGLADGVALLTDLNSTNGVHVDGQRLQGAAKLQPGARIAVGPFTLTYQRGSAEELAEAEAAEREQARAVSYIQALLPAPMRDGPVRAEWHFVPSAQLGGDAFGYRWLDERRLALFLLDVSGHGVGSALLAASAANMLRAPSLGADPGDPVAVLRGINAAFQMDDHNGLFFSLWYGVYDRSAHGLRYASAGHHPAYLLQGEGMLPLVTRAPAIGMAPSARFAAADAEVRAGSRLYLFSDGAFEVTLADGAPGTIEHVLALLRDRPDPGALFDTIRESTGRRPFEDDVSLLSFEFR